MVHSMARQFRVQVVGLLDGELHTILWVGQDQSAIRCGLALPGTDLHVTLREGEGTHHRGRGDADIAAAVTYMPRPATLDPEATEQIGGWVFGDLQDDFQRLKTYKAGESASQVTLDLASLPRCLEVRVYITKLRNLYLPHLIGSMKPRMVHVDISDEPPVLMLIGTA